MTKKQFIQLADAIRAHNAKHPRTGWQSAGAPWGAPFNRSHIEALADFCAAQNPAFDRGRWLAYGAGMCGANGGAIKKGGK